MLNIPASIVQAGTVAGFTTATWGTVTQTTSVQNGRLYSVTSKGGTQPANVTVHSASKPWTIMVTRPPEIRVAPVPNAAGVLPTAPLNTYHISGQKGLLVMAGQPAQKAKLDFSFSIPAGSDLADPDELAAFILAATSALTGIVQGIIDTAKTGDV